MPPHKLRSHRWAEEFPVIETSFIFSSSLERKEKKKNPKDRTDVRGILGNDASRPSSLDVPNLRVVMKGSLSSFIVKCFLYSFWNSYETVVLKMFHWGERTQIISSSEVIINMLKGRIPQIFVIGITVRERERKGVVYLQNPETRKLNYSSLIYQRNHHHTCFFLSCIGNWLTFLFTGSCSPNFLNLIIF